MNHPRLSDEEELVNAITHGVACIGGAIAAILVLLNSDFTTPNRQVAFLLYSVSLVLLFWMSMLSHAVSEPKRRHRFRAWDQGAIYLFIAGTYTPSIIAFASGWTTAFLLTFVWGIAAFGFYAKVIAEHQVNAATTASYLALGWVPAMFLLPVVPREYFLWLFAGGVTYSIGVAFLLNDRRFRFFHAGWHLFVVLAAGIHFYAICSMAI